MSHVAAPQLLSDLGASMGRKKGGSGGKGAAPAASAASASSQGDLPKEILATLSEKLAASRERLKKDLGAIHAGRASPDLLQRVEVDAYGTQEPLNKVAQVVVKDHQTLMVNVFDPSLVKAVSEAIRTADLQLNPQVVGSAVKVPVPRVTQEYREKLAKQVAAAGEEAKVAARKVLETGVLFLCIASPPPY